MAKTVNVADLIIRLKEDRERLKKGNEELKARVSELIAEKTVLVEKCKVVASTPALSPEAVTAFSPQVCQTGKMVWLFVLVNTVFFILLVVWIAWLGNLQVSSEYPLMDEWTIEEDAGDTEPPLFLDSDSEADIEVKIVEQPDMAQTVVCPSLKTVAPKKSQPRRSSVREKKPDIMRDFFSAGLFYLPPPLSSATLKIRSRWFRPADTESE